ncbi:MAG: WD40 repeat domain-containing protein [Planctomycetaceae bacterium]|nr:WD40 repeat domain-containing protein [Planctomycetaceae bacterium]
MKKYACLAVLLAIVSIQNAQAEVPFVELKGHTEGYRGGVLAIAFSLDGKKVVTGSNGTTARVWDVESGRELKKLEGHTSTVWAVAFSPDGKTVVTGSEDGTARIWDAESGKELKKLAGHVGAVRSVAFSPDGKKIVTGSGLSQGQVYDGTAHIWDADSGRELKRLLEIWDEILSVSFSPDGTKIITTEFGASTVRIWDAGSYEQLQQFGVAGGTGGSLTSATFSPDGKKILTADHHGNIQLFVADSGERLKRLERHANEALFAYFIGDFLCRRHAHVGLDEGFKEFVQELVVHESTGRFENIADVRVFRVENTEDNDTDYLQRTLEVR